MRLKLEEGGEVSLRHAPTLESLADVRRRIYGGRLDALAERVVSTDTIAHSPNGVSVADLLAGPMR